MTEVTATICTIADHEYDGTPGDWSVELIVHNDHFATVIKGDLEAGDYPVPYELDNLVEDWARANGWDIEGFAWVDGTRMVTLGREQA